MKRIVSILILSTFSFIFLSVSGCKKDSKTEEESSCKTCTAYKTAEKPEATAQVCNSTQEQAFRSQHSGQEIGCR